MPSHAEDGGDGGRGRGEMLPFPAGTWATCPLRGLGSGCSHCPSCILHSCSQQIRALPGRDAEVEAGKQPEEQKAQGLHVPAHGSWPRSPAKLGQKDTRVSELRTQNSLRSSDQVKPEPRPLGCHPWPPLSGHLDLSALLTALSSHCLHHHHHHHKYGV